MSKKIDEHRYEVDLSSRVPDSYEMLQRAGPELDLFHHTVFRLERNHCFLKASIRYLCKLEYVL